MAEKNFGKAFYLGASAAANAAFTKIAEVLSVKAPSPARGTIDTTTHDSVNGAQEYMTEGTYDPGEMTIQLHWIPGSASDALILAALASGDGYRMKVTSNGRDNAGAATKMQTTGVGIITGYEPDDQPTQGKQTATLSVKASGVWTQAPFAA